MNDGAKSIHEIDPATLTPAMRQYQRYKGQYPDAVLFFRIGDFYECFYEDARLVSRVLGVALTARSKGENPVPMAGVPYHAVETYLHRMVAAGHKVAICEQVQEAKDAKGNGGGVIDREVTRLVTPGTLTEEAMLDGREENFVGAVVGGTLEVGSKKEEEGGCAVAWCELSTGKFLTFCGSVGACREELARVRPRELLYGDEGGKGAPGWVEDFRAAIAGGGGGVTLTGRPGWQMDGHHAAATLKGHYGVGTFAGFGYGEEGGLELRAAGAVVAYLHETQKAALEHLRPPRKFERAGFLTIDQTSLRSLEVVRTLRGNTAEGSLVGAMDRTLTPMGSRLLKNWLCYPLREVGAIRRRHDAVGRLVEAEQTLAKVRGALTDCSDVERIAARVCCRRGSARDLVALARSLGVLETAAVALAELAAETGADFGEEEGTWERLMELAPQGKKIAGEICEWICEEPSAHLRDGGVIRDGCHEELDRLRLLSKDSRTFLAEYQGKLMARCAIPSLKVGYNKVTGFYIEVTNTHAAKIPADFVRRQTVRNAERYITPELKQYESEILTAQERGLALEAELFEELRGRLAERVEVLQELAGAAAELDVLCGLATLARGRRYVRPVMTEERGLEIVAGRHPVVEQGLGERFVPNDCCIGKKTEVRSQKSEGGGEAVDCAEGDVGATLHLITGPNMAGKSTYIRQVALLVLMAQAGSFVPAEGATIGVVDRIFTRVGASDDLAGGQSTFMVEMTETANILHHATEQSLVILDEIGRGTSTLDGLALAWAIAEYLADTTKARTLFATHYHELTELAETSKAVANYNVLVREWEEEVVFMHRIAPGRADRSYGVQVARLAGIPRSVIARAKGLMGQLVVHVGKAGGRAKAASATVAPQMGMFDPVDQQALGQLRALDMNRMSPMQAWEALRALQGMLGEKKGQ